MSDPEIEKITLVKASRIGFTALITAAIGSYISNDPAQTLVVLPTESDARDFTISDLEPTFAASPVLRNALKVEPGETDRNTILSRRFPGGSLKIVASRAPRNLRRHTARLLYVDEADACEQTTEGDPIKLAEQRTTTFRIARFALVRRPSMPRRRTSSKLTPRATRGFLRFPARTVGPSPKSCGCISNGMRGSPRPRSFAARRAGASSRSGTSLRWSTPADGGRPGQKLWAMLAFG